MGLAGTVPITGRRPLTGRGFADRCYLAEAVIGFSFERMESSSSTFRATLRTDDGALISMRSFGLRHGPPEVMEALARGEAVDPAAYYFSDDAAVRNLTPEVRILETVA